jgi:hypothetical protein
MPPQMWKREAEALSLLPRAELLAKLLQDLLDAVEKSARARRQQQLQQLQLLQQQLQLQETEWLPSNSESKHGEATAAQAESKHGGVRHTGQQQQQQLKQMQERHHEELATEAEAALDAFVQMVRSRYGKARAQDLVTVVHGGGNTGHLPPPGGNKKMPPELKDHPHLQGLAARMRQHLTGAGTGAGGGGGVGGGSGPSSASVRPDATATNGILSSPPVRVAAGGDSSGGDSGGGIERTGNSDNGLGAAEAGAEAAESAAAAAAAAAAPVASPEQHVAFMTGLLRSLDYDHFRDCFRDIKHKHGVEVAVELGAVRGRACVRACCVKKYVPAWWATR